MTPEDLLARLVAALGEEVGGRAWLVLDEALSGRRLYWPARVRRDLLARTAYEARCRGDHPLTIARRLGVDKRTVERWVAAELRRRRLRQALPKNADPAAETEVEEEATP